MNKLIGLTLESAYMIKEGLQLLKPSDCETLDTQAYLLSQLKSIIEHLEKEEQKLAPILDGTGFSDFWKTCPELPWYKAMQKFHASK
jgi:hypothetical protein